MFLAINMIEEYNLMFRLMDVKIVRTLYMDCLYTYLIMWIVISSRFLLSINFDIIGDKPRDNDLIRSKTWLIFLSWYVVQLYGSVKGKRTFANLKGCFQDSGFTKSCSIQKGKWIKPSFISVIATSSFLILNGKKDDAKKSFS